MVKVILGVLFSIGVPIVAATIVFLLFKLKRKYFEKAVMEYTAATGVPLEIETTGIPPLKFWIRNRKGDCWGRVRFPDGTVKWARLRGRIFTSGPPLTFFDP